MRKKRFFLWLLVFSQSSFAVIGEDNLILLQMLGAELQATAGILEMIDKSSETIDMAKEVNFIVLDKVRQAQQIAYLLHTVKELPKRAKDIKSITNLYGVLGDARGTFEEGKYLSKSLLNFDRNGQEVTRSIAERIRVDGEKLRNLSQEYFKGVSSSDGKGVSKVLGSRSEALNTLISSNITDQLDLMIKSDLLEKHKKSTLEHINKVKDYKRKMLLGLIPNICFEDYQSGNWNYPTFKEAIASKNQQVCNSRNLAKSNQRRVKHDRG